ncbi:MAG TPA: proton-conducting membrane transporter [Actinobacteria bacterium]|nr:proton-conducting membrane transporter [Actinomycetota bacterium]
MDFHLILTSLIIAIPFLGAGITYWFGHKLKTAWDYLPFLFSLTTLILTSILFFGGSGGHVIIKYPFLPFSKVELSINSLNVLLAFLTALVWTAAMLFSVSYMKKSVKRRRFYVFMLLAFSANLGVFLAGNFLTLFIFFELLGLSAYPLIVHNESIEAFEAGTKYLIMVFLGDLALLLGILFYYKIAGSVAFATGLSGGSDYFKVITFALMGIGFGVKAGVVPLHIWLPDAHPVSPSPASALLSGIMIKAGAYGIIRSLFSIFGPEIRSIDVGFVVIWVGVVTMFVAVFMALLQENAKKMLAYHSISQMGYIVLGIGCAIYLGGKGALAIGGSLYHIVNHALFKTSLFLTVGAVFYRTGEFNMYKLGGLLKKMPIIAFCTIIASLGISGIPLFNGYVSKTLIHQAVTHLGHGGWVSLAEILFLIISGGTIASFIKLFALIFLGKLPEKYESVKDAPPFMIAGILPLTALVIILGILPNRFWGTFMIPLLKNLGYKTLSLNSVSIINILTGHDIQSLIISLFVGILIFAMGTKYDLFHMRFPCWFGVNYWFEQLTMGLYFLTHREVHLPEIMVAGPGTEAVKEGSISGIYARTEVHRLSFFVISLKRRIKYSYLKSKAVLTEKINYIIGKLRKGFLAKLYQDLSASKTGIEFELYVQDLNFGMFLVLFLLVICFISFRLIG